MINEFQDHNKKKIMTLERKKEKKLQNNEDSILFKPNLFKYIYILYYIYI